MLTFLYDTIPGRIILKILVHPVISKLGGRFCDSQISKFLIPCFIKRNHIRMDEFEKVTYRNFNQFFCRKIKAGARSVDQNPNAFVAPCDGLLSAYRIKDGLVIPVKSSRFGMEDLLKDKKMAQEYEGGTCLVFRLCVNHYHRYVYLDDGTKTENVFIPGVLHTVRPIALRTLPVFAENSREYTVLHTKHFGKVIQMEVGAMLVGRIRNLHGCAVIRRGQEKGFFEYGGSTIILLVKKERAVFVEKFYTATKQGREIPVKLGQRLNEI